MLRARASLWCLPRVAASVRASTAAAACVLGTRADCAAGGLRQFAAQPKAERTAQLAHQSATSDHSPAADAPSTGLQHQALRVHRRRRHTVAEETAKAAASVIAAAALPRALHELGVRLFGALGPCVPPHGHAVNHNDTHRRKVVAAFGAIDVSALESLTPAALQYALTSMYLAEKRPHLLVMSRRENTVQGMLSLTQLEAIDSEYRKSRGLAEPAGAWDAQSWSSPSSRFTVTPTDLLAVNLRRQLRDINSRLCAAKLVAREPTDAPTAEIHRLVSYTFRLFHALRSSGLFDLMAFGQEVNDVGFSVLSRRLRSRQHAAVISGLSDLKARLEAPEMAGLVEKMQATHQPIVLQEIAELVQAHVDLFVLPPPTVQHATEQEAARLVTQTAVEAEFWNCPPWPLGSSHAPPSVAYPSSSPVANLVRLISLFHSVRHLYAGGKFLSLCTEMLTVDVPTLARVRSHRAARADFVALTIVKKVAYGDVTTWTMNQPEKEEDEVDPSDDRAGTPTAITQSSEDAPIPSDSLALPTPQSMHRTYHLQSRSALLWQTSWEDATYVLQILAIHRLQVGGLSAPSRAFRALLRDRVHVPEQATLGQLTAFLEAFAKLEFIGEGNILRLLSRVADLAELPTHAQLEEAEIASEDDPTSAIVRRMPHLLRRSLPLSVQTTLRLDPPGPNNFANPNWPPRPVSLALLNQATCGPRTVGHALALAFISFAVTVDPNSELTPRRWHRWQWNTPANRSAPYKMSPLRVARVLCAHYTALFENPTLFHVNTFDPEDALLREATDFAWSLILLEFEQHPWCVRFLRSFISSVESRFEVRSVTGGRGSGIYNKRTSRRITSSAMPHRLHQVSIALFLRTRTLDEERAENAPRGAVVPAPEEADDVNLNFSSTFRDFFRLSRSTNTTAYVSNFQVMVYDLLSDQDGLCAFRQRVVHSQFELHRNDRVVKELLSNAQGLAGVEGQEMLEHSEVALVDNTQATGSANRGGPPPVDFFIEHTTSVGYVIDAAIFDTRLLISQHDREKERRRIGPASLTQLPAVQAALPTTTHQTINSSTAVEVDGPYHYRLGVPHVLNSVTRLRKKQLRLCGWHVVSISHAEWNKRKPFECAAWIASLLPKRLLRKERERKYHLTEVKKKAEGQRLRREKQDAQRAKVSQNSLFKQPSTVEVKSDATHFGRVDPHSAEQLS